MFCARSGSAIRVFAIILGGILEAGHITAQSAPTDATSEQQQAEHEYTKILERVKQGDMTVDFRAFRVAGALRSAHASTLETGERAAFRSKVASADWQGALDSAKQALDRDYASPIGHFDAMVAYQGLRQIEDAAAHEKLLNALLDSIRKSGDGKSPETAYFVVTTQEEYIFLSRVLNLRATSQNMVRKGGHVYDVLLVPDRTTNQILYLWFNADFDFHDGSQATAAAQDSVLASTSVIHSNTMPDSSAPGVPLGSGQVRPGALSQPDSTYPTGPRRPTEAEISHAVLIRRVQPEYTQEARAAGLQGSVVLYLEVNPMGEVAKVRVIQSLGLGLDEKASEAARQWRFKPGMKEGRQVRVAQSAEISFLLNPANSWHIKRSAYRVNGSGVWPRSQLSKPMLTKYSSPASEACVSDGSMVIANLQVTKEGKPEHVTLVEVHGQATSDVALKAIRSWRFQPGLLNGKPRDGSGTVEMECRAAQGSLDDPAEQLATEVTHSIGEGVSAPKILYKVEPDYSDDARKARFQGAVVLSLQVDTSGHAVNLLVTRMLGLGLDEKAMEAINQWRFKPGTKDGTPVKVSCYIEVNFRLI